VVVDRATDATLAETCVLCRLVKRPRLVEGAIHYLEVLGVV
jgi:hypothetical protein